MVLYELSFATFGTYPGTFSIPLLGKARKQFFQDSMLEYRFLEGLRSRARPVVLTRGGGYPRVIPRLDINPQVAALGLAEAAAFSGGGGLATRIQEEVYGEANNRFRKMVEQHPEYFDGWKPYARSALLFFPEQQYIGDYSHMYDARVALRELTRNHALFQVISERRVEQGDFEGVTHLMIPGRVTLTDRQFSVLEDFVENGGTITLSGKISLLAPVSDVMVRRVGEWNAVGIGQTMSRGKGKIANVGYPRKLPSDPALETVLLTSDRSVLLDRVAVNAYVSEEGGSYMLHLVNYHVPQGREPQPVSVIRNLGVTVPVAWGKVVLAEGMLYPELSAIGRGKNVLEQLGIYAVMKWSDSGGAAQ